MRSSDGCSVRQSMYSENARRPRPARRFWIVGASSSRLEALGLVADRLLVRLGMPSSIPIVRIGICAPRSPMKSKPFWPPDVLRPSSPCYAGDIGIGPNLKLAVPRQGIRSGPPDRRPHRRDAVVGLYAAEEPYPDQQLVHVHADAGELGRVYRPDAQPSTLAMKPSDLRLANWPPRACLGRIDGGAARRLSRLVDAAETGPGEVRWDRSCATSPRLPEEQSITNGAGNYATWVTPVPPLPRFATRWRRRLRLDGLRYARRCRRRCLFPDREVIASLGTAAS